MDSITISRHVKSFKVMVLTVDNSDDKRYTNTEAVYV